MNIGVIGLGYVGLTLSVSLAKNGTYVYGCEKNENILSSLQDGKAHFFEEGMDINLNEVIQNGHLRFALEFDPSIKYDYFIITVGTPLLEDDNAIDLSSIKKALEELRGIYNGKQLVVLRSTVEVGTTASVALPVLHSLIPRDSNIEPLIAFCPERTVEGKAMSELLNLPQIISGNTKGAITLAKNLFSVLGVNCIETPTIEGAELIKLFNNTYRDVQFAIGNFFNEIAQQYRLNGSQLIKIANQDYARSDIAKPGLVGGPCLEKDPYILTNNLISSPGANFVRYARNYNELLETQIIEWVHKNIKSSKKGRILVMGIAFKGQPETSDLRGSNSVSIVKKLRTFGYDIDVQDFCAFNDELINLSGNVYQFSLKSVNEYELILILNNHRGYEEVTLNWINQNLLPTGKVFDCWDILAHLNCRKVVSIGEMLIQAREV